MATTATPAPSDQPRMSAIQRIIGALFNPQATFQDIARKPGWLPPVLIIVVLSLMITFLFTQRVGWEQFMAKQIESSPRTANMSAEQKQQIIQQQTRFAPIFGYAGSVVFPFLGTLIVAAVFLGVFNGVAGAGVRFSQAMGVAAHGFVPNIVGGLLGIVILYLKDPDAVDIQNLVGSNLGALVSEGGSKFIQSLATSIDLFSIWTMVLLAIGFTACNPKKLSFGRSLTYIVVVWAIYSLAKAGLAGIFS